MDDDNKYIRFCAEAAGVYVEHAPGQGTSEIKWVQRYENTYGRLPQVWFTRDDGTFDSEGYDKYLKTGVMIASWDCGPVLPDKGKSIQSEIDKLKTIIDINKKIEDLNQVNLPELEQIKKIDEAAVINSIKEQIDKFNIEKIKQKYPKP